MACIQCGKSSAYRANFKFLNTFTRRGRKQLKNCNLTIQYKKNLEEQIKHKYRGEKEIALF